MFNKDFYPTPDHVIQMMIGTHDLYNKVVLEPSAGKGNIVDYLNELSASVIACEKDNDLQKIVHQKAQFLKPDFLQVQSHEVSHIDYIIMNPPFSRDEQHILHAWEIAPEGCVIISLCNYQTLDNRFSRGRRELHSLIENYGYSENLGNVFSQSERDTDIEIGMITLYKPKTGDNEFTGFFEDEEESEQQANGIIPYNEIREIINRYVAAVGMFDQVMEQNSQINGLTSVFGSYNNITFGAFKREGSSITNVSRETFKKGLQISAWNYIFNRLNMDKYVTTKLKEDLNKFVEKQSKVPFTMKNVYKMLELIVGTNSSRMDQALCDLFDKVTKHYHDNRYNLEGWKTNDSYIVNKKIILPYVVRTDSYNKDRIEIPYNSSNVDLIHDLIKGLCYLTGQSFDNTQSLREWSEGTPRSLEWILQNEEIQLEFKKWYDNDKRNYVPVGWTLEQFQEHESKSAFKNKKYCDRPEYGTWYDWNFFRIKAFKKGTLHLEFKDKMVWERFNRRVSELKGHPLPEKL